MYLGQGIVGVGQSQYGKPQHGLKYEQVIEIFEKKIKSLKH